MSPEIWSSDKTLLFCLWKVPARGTVGVCRLQGAGASPASVSPPVSQLTVRCAFLMKWARPRIPRLNYFSGPLGFFGKHETVRCKRCLFRQTWNNSLESTERPGPKNPDDYGRYISEDDIHDHVDHWTRFDTWTCWAALLQDLWYEPNRIEARRKTGRQTINLIPEGQLDDDWRRRTPWLNPFDCGDDTTLTKNIDMNNLTGNWPSGY